MYIRNLCLFFLCLVIVHPAEIFSQINFIEHPIANLVQGTEGHMIDCADINGDGVQDLIQIDYDEDEIYWWEFQAEGNWEQHLISTTVMAPRYACGADFDLDGDTDLVVITISGVNHIYFLRQDEDSWAEYVITSNFSAPTCISAVDMDSDGDMDIISASYNENTIKWWEYESDDVWFEHEIATGQETPGEAVAADLDNDGDPDVVLATMWDDSIIWWENENDDNWTQHYIDSNVDHPSLIEIEDIDNDGDLDVMSVSGHDYYYAWWEQTENGTWNQHNILTDVTSIIYLEAADLDDDGDIDFLSNFNQALNLFEMTQPEIWENSVLYAAHNYKPLIADIDNDTDLDIFVLGRNDGNLFWFEQEGTPVQPGQFSLISPENQDTVWQNETVLRWEESIDPDTGEATHYDVWVGTDPDIGNNILMADSIEVDSLYLVNLADDLTFYWTVRATDDNSVGRWADEIFTFHTYFPEAPLPFELMYPGDGTVIADESSFPLEFHWTQTTDPDPNDMINYTLEVSADANFTNPSLFEAENNTQYNMESLPIDNYWWRVRATDSFGNETYSSETRTLLVTLDVTQDQNLIPGMFTVSSAYPNPFNPSVSIEYFVPNEGNVSISIFNIQGQTVYQNNNIQNSGYHKFTFDKSQAGSELVSGIYFIQIQYLEEVELQKVMLLK